MRIRPVQHSLSPILSPREERVLAALSTTEVSHRGRARVLTILDVAERAGVSATEARLALERLMQIGLVFSLEHDRGVSRSSEVLFGLRPACARTPHLRHPPLA